MFDIDRRRRDIALGDGEFFSPSREKREDEKVDESQRSAQLFGFFAVVRVEICSVHRNGSANSQRSLCVERFALSIFLEFGKVTLPRGFLTPEMERASIHLPQ